MRFTDDDKFFRIQKSKASYKVLQEDTTNCWMRKELIKLGKHKQILTFQYRQMVSKHR